MGKQFKVIEISHSWSPKKLRAKVEDELNRVSKDGWEIVDISFIGSMYTAMITISK